MTSSRPLLANSAGPGPARAATARPIATRFSAILTALAHLKMQPNLFFYPPLGVVSHGDFYQFGPSECHQPFRSDGNTHSWMCEARRMTGSADVTDEYAQAGGRDLYRDCDGDPGYCEGGRQDRARWVRQPSVPFFTLPHSSKSASETLSPSRAISRSPRSPMRARPRPPRRPK